MASTIDDDFAAYVALRWESLVRTLVLLGCPPESAEEVTRAALARCHRSWARIRRSDDVDVRVYRRLLRTWPPTRRRHTRRTALVLHSVGGLSEAQVGAVLGQRTTALDEDQDAGDLLGTDPGSIEVSPPPVDAIVAGSRSGTGRRPVLLVLVGSLAVVAAGIGFVALRDPHPKPTTGPSTTATKVKVTAKADLPYLTDGQLHIGGVTLTARAVTDLADPGVGAVYRTQEADIVLVDADGGTAEIGHNAAPGLVADPVTGRVFWLTYTQQLVAYDARRGRTVTMRNAPDPVASFRYARPLALTAGVAYYATRDGVRAWDVGSNRVTGPAAGRRVFLDRVGDLVVSNTRDGLGIVATRRGKRLWHARGLAAPRVVISPDANRVVVRDASARPALYDARTGKALPTGLPATTRVTTVAFTRDGATAYVTLQDERHSQLVVCGGPEAQPQCTTVSSVAGGLTVAP